MNKAASMLGWLAVAILGAFALGTIALTSGRNDQRRMVRCRRRVRVPDRLSLL